MQQMMGGVGAGAGAGAGAKPARTAGATAAAGCAEEVAARSGTPPAWPPNAPRSRRRSASRRRGAGVRSPFSRDATSAGGDDGRDRRAGAAGAERDGAPARVLAGRVRGGGAPDGGAAAALADGPGRDGARAGGAAGGGRAGRAGGGPAADARAARPRRAASPISARLSPAAGLGRAFGGQAALQVGKGLLKATLVGVLAWLTVRPLLAGLAALAGAPVPRLVGALGAGRRRGWPSGSRWSRWRWGSADYLLVRRRHLARQRMTREEVRREHKESEGDPSHRAERQRLHRELMEQRMVAEVRKADFVVVNPDHIAVALRYDRDGEAAPGRRRARRAPAGRADQAGGARGGRADLPRRDAGAVAARSARGRRDPRRAVRGGRGDPAGGLRDDRARAARPPPRDPRRPLGVRAPASSPSRWRRAGSGHRMAEPS